MSDDIQVGDLVRVVYEDYVIGVDKDGTVHVSNDGAVDQAGHWFHPEDQTVTEVTVLEDAREVTTFKPGDVVRSRVSPGLTYTLGRGGYIAHHANHEVRTGDRKPFTSEECELVKLHESPL